MRGSVALLALVICLLYEAVEGKLRCPLGSKESLAYFRQSPMMEVLPDRIPEAMVAFRTPSVSVDDPPLVDRRILLGIKSVWSPCVCDYKVT